jgi:hypothetical protein
MGIKGCLLTGKLVMVLSHPAFDVDLPGMGSRLLFLLVSLLLYGEELHFWLGCHGPHRGHRDGLESWSVLRRWRSCDGVSWGRHVTPLGVGGSRAPPGA